MTRTLIQVRCDRGAAIAGRLGFPEATADAIRSLDEHWCGLGYARGLAGEGIPVLARIALLAQTLEAFHAQAGIDAALAVARERRGTWFDPSLVDVALGWRHDRGWWARLSRDDAEREAIAIEPPDHVRFVDDEGLDEIARAFADIIDAKSPYTFHHSTRVADYARQAGEVMGIDPTEQRRIHRAGLLHDIGKLGVSNRILDKPGKLDAGERAEIERHPAMTLEILERVSAFSGFARMAALHHEKLDGSGYPWRVSGEGLETGARLLAVADVYDALTSARPYRGAMTPAGAFAIIARERGPRLCAAAADALAGVVGV
jgi:putative nucleotidyltransferase with HDIG domain